RFFENDRVVENARILALSDRYCACVSPRRYRRTLLPDAALREVVLNQGKAGDPMLTTYFIKTIGTHPPGTRVRLQNGEAGVVIRKGSSPMTPVVCALFDAHGAALPMPQLRDTAKQHQAIREALTATQLPLDLSMQQLWGEPANP